MNSSPSAGETNRYNVKWNKSMFWKKSAKDRYEKRRAKFSKNAESILNNQQIKRKLDDNEIGIEQLNEFLERLSGSGHDSAVENLRKKPDKIDQVISIYFKNNIDDVNYYIEIANFLTYGR